MISLVDGLACRYPRRASERVVVRLPARAGRFVPHQLLRSALPAIGDAVGESALAALVTPHRAALSIVFGGLDGSLSEPEHGRAHALSARLTSHLTHNAPMLDLLGEAYARFLLAADELAPLVIVVDDLRHLDAASFAVLQQLLRSGGDRAPDVVVGYTSELAERVHVDDRGIAWDIGAVDLRRALASLRRVSRQSEPHDGHAAVLCSCPITRNAWDRSPDVTAERMLARLAGDLGEGDLGEGERAELAAAIQQVFSMFAFDTALRLALGALDAKLPFAPRERALVCGVAALSAHNRQFFSRGNHRLARFLRECYSDALAHESDAERRISLCYRLAVTCGRRLGDLAGARRAIDQGLAELAAAELPRLNHQLQASWLHNVDALVQVRAGDLAAAATCCDHAYDALDVAVAVDDPGYAEVALTRLVVGENALTLASARSDEPRRAIWLARARDGLHAWPALTVATVLEQQRAHIDRLELVQAIEAGCAALDLAESRFSSSLEYYVMASLSDLSFRLADYDAAAEYGDRARALGEEVGDFDGTELALELRAAEIADARGRFEEAEDILESLIVRGAGSVALRAEVHGRLAHVCARHGDRERALQLIEQSIELSAELGELDLLLRTSCRVGDVASALGMLDHAREAYANCFELLAGDDVRSTPARETVRLRAMVGRLRVESADDDQLARCIRTLPRLLAQERDAWPAARELVRSLPPDPAIAPELQAILSTVDRALAARAEPVAGGA
jgi:tetratricopeptide (TPR) repeat protein